MYRILFVDDEVQIVEGLKKIIDWERYQIGHIEVANTYEEAVAKAMDFKPHIALVDVCIDDRKGYDLIRDIRKFDGKIQFVMISGHDEFKFAKEAMVAGSRDYLLKPIDKGELKKVIERIIVEDLDGEIVSDYRDIASYDEILKLQFDDMSKLIRKVITIVHTEYEKNINLKLLADRFEMNSSYLGQLFLKETNMKFSEYLMRYRLSIAKKLIESSDEKISYIAAKVGYTNMNYFYIQFQNYYQASPLEFRR